MRKINKRTARKVVLTILLPCSSFFLLTCGKAGGVGAAILCSVLSESRDSSSLTIGLGSAFLDYLRTSQLNLQGDDEVNLKIKDTINSALTRADLYEYLNIEDVTDVPTTKGEDDGVRFFRIGGELASVSQLASSVLNNQKVKDALVSSLSLTSGDDVFDFIQDSFKIAAAETSSVSSGYPSALKEEGVGYAQSQWAYSQTDIDAAVSTLASLDDQQDQVIVAVIDTGVDYDHPGLESVLLRENDAVLGYNFVEGASDAGNADDDQGHGTHCAGIIAATPTASDKMTGVAELGASGKIKIMPVKVLDKNGSGSSASINKGIRWAIAHGADVISMSLGGAVDFQSLKNGGGAENKIIRDAVDKGIIVVVAAGNENCPLGGTCEQTEAIIFSNKIENYTVIPCSYNGTICVGASDPNGTLAEYSNFPSKSVDRGVDPKIKNADSRRASPDISAPGTHIYSTYPGGGYKLLSGTSMATPYVAGLAALYKLKATKAMLKSGGSAQRSFWNLLQSAEADLKDEGELRRSFIGQVDLAYFSAKLADIINGSSNAKKPEIRLVDDPQPAGGEQAPNLMSLFCGN